MLRLLFATDRGWERPPERIGDVKQLEGPRGLALR
jgi:hypothetical protein